MKHTIVLSALTLSLTALPAWAKPLATPVDHKTIGTHNLHITAGAEGAVSSNLDSGAPGSVGGSGKGVLEFMTPDGPRDCNVEYTTSSTRVSRFSYRQEARQSCFGVIPQLTLRGTLGVDDKAQVIGSAEAKGYLNFGSGGLLREERRKQGPSVFGLGVEGRFELDSQLRSYGMDVGLALRPARTFEVTLKGSIPQLNRVEQRGNNLGSGTFAGELDLHYGDDLWDARLSGRYEHGESDTKILSQLDADGFTEILTGSLKQDHFNLIRATGEVRLHPFRSPAGVYFGAKGIFEHTERNEKTLDAGGTVTNENNINENRITGLATVGVDIAL